MALFGQDYFTVPGMLSIVQRVLSSELRTAHLGQAWDFKSMLDDPLPCKARKMHNLDPAHAFRFTRSDGGISMQWKQWCTDETWSRPIQLLAPHEVHLVAAWRPARLPMEFEWIRLRERDASHEALHPLPFWLVPRRVGRAMAGRWRLAATLAFLPPSPGR